MKDKIAYIRNTINQKQGIETSLKVVIISLSLLFVVMIAIEYSEYIFTPAGSDEQFYYLNSKSVAENGTLRAAMTFNGYGSAVFGADAHGFAYPLVYGIAGIFFGYSESTIVIFNIALLLLSAVLIASMKFVQPLNKLVMFSIILVHPILFYLITSYHVEAFYLLFSIVIFYYLYILYNNKASKTYIVLFFLMLIFFSVFRVSWIIFSFAIIPLAANKNERILYTGVAALTTLVVYFGFSVFSENFDQILGLSGLIKNVFEGDISAALVRLAYRANSTFYTLTAINVAALFTDYIAGEPFGFQNLIAVLYRWFIILSVVYLLWRFKKHRDNFALALGLPLALLFMANFIVGIPEHMIRYMLPAVIFISLFVIIQNNKPAIVLIIVIHLAIFPLTFITQDNWYDRKKERVIALEQMENITFESISENVIGKHRLVLIDYSTERIVFPTHNLPVRNNEGKQIRYAQIYYRGNFNYEELGFVLTLPGKAPGQTYEIEHDVRIVNQTTYYDFYELVRE